MDGDGNENVEKTTYKQNNNLARTSPFFVLFIPVLHDYDVKMPNFAFYGGHKEATTKFYFAF